MTKELDQQLRKWSESRQPDREHLSRLADGIRGRVVEAAASGCRDIPAFPQNTLGLKLLYAGLGAAAASIVFALAVLIDGEPARQSCAVVPAYAQVSEKDIEVGATLFDEMEKLFSTRLKWVAESGGDVGLGIESAPEPQLDRSMPVLVRLVVVARDQATKVTRTVWKADVLVRSEQLVEINPDRKSASVLGLWVYPLADGKIAVDTSLSLDVPVRLVSKSNRVAARGKPEQIMCLQTDGVEYRVFQAVELLAEQSGA